MHIRVVNEFSQHFLAGSEYCLHMDEFYEVGQQVINDCEESCTCLPTGEFKCSPVCEMHGVPDVEEGCHVIPGESCCDFKVSCSVGGGKRSLRGVHTKPRLNRSKRLTRFMFDLKFPHIFLYQHFATNLHSNSIMESLHLLALPIEQN